ncbi:MAG: hypothetical protein ACRDGK_05985 [Actinomycetota bacterium]
MFTIEQRDALRDRVLRLAKEDERVIAGALVGSLAVGADDRFSDLDLTFGVADDVEVFLALACLRVGRPAAQDRSYDDLSADTLARLEDAHVGALEPVALRAALEASVLALLLEGEEARLPHAHVVAQRLGELH